MGNKHPGWCVTADRSPPGESRPRRLGAGGRAPRSEHRAVWPCLPALLLILILALGPLPVWGGEAAGRQAPDPAEPAEVGAHGGGEEARLLLDASHLTLDGAHWQALASGEVRLRYGATTLLADEVLVNLQEEDAYARGRVRLLYGDDLLLCDAVHYHWTTQTGTVEQGRIFVESTGYRIGADLLEKTGTDTYVLEGVSFTTCRCPSPEARLPWVVHAGSGELTVGGYARVRKARLRVFGVPVLYLPKAYLPVKLTRETGFLVPSVGQSGNLGFQLAVPFFWAIDGSTDATFTLEGMTKRGVKPSAELRYRPSKRTEGLWDLSGYPDLDTGSFRYGVAARHTQRLGRSFYNRLDLNLVSDNQYLEDFPGLLGWSSDRLAVSRGGVGFERGSFHASVEARYADRVDAPAQDLAAQEAPSLHADLIRRQVGPSWLSVALASEAANFVDTQGDDRLRAWLFPEGFLRFGPVGGVTVQAHGGVRQLVSSGGLAGYATAPGADLSISSSNTDARTLVDAGAELQLRLGRSFRWGSYRLAHVIRPILDYRYVHRVAGEDFPVIMDGVDQLGDLNWMTYGLETRLYGRREAAFSPGASGLLAELRVVSSVDLAWERQHVPDPRIFSDIRIRGRVHPRPHISLLLDLQLNPRDASLRTLEGGVALWDRRKRHGVYVGYLDHEAYRVDPWTRVELRDAFVREYLFEGIGRTVRGRLETRIGRRLRASWDTLYLIDSAGKMENHVAVTYLSRCECWSTIVTFRQTIRPDDFGVSVRLQLEGLGSTF